MTESTTSVNRAAARRKAILRELEARFVREDSEQPSALSATLAVTDFPWSSTRFIFGYGVSADEAIERCLKLAAAQRWSAPKWWQWWRRKDATIPFVSYGFNGSFDSPSYPQQPPSATR